MKLRQRKPVFAQQRLALQHANPLWIFTATRAILSSHSAITRIHFNHDGPFVRTVCVRARAPLLLYAILAYLVHFLPLPRQTECDTTVNIHLPV